MTFYLFPNGEVFLDNKAQIGKILKDMDGYYKWWPIQRKGYLDEGFLFAMADFLKRLNASWDAEIKALQKP